MIRDTVTMIIRRTKERPALIAALALLLALLSGLAGYMLASSGGAEQAQADGNGRRILYWYDPMIPNERYPGPGKSSMGMELIPKYADEGAGGGVTVSPSMMQNLGIRMARVETRDIAPVVRAVGRVDFDQRLITQVQTLTPGFIERLSVRAEGEPIGAGRVVAEVYSPELLAAQNEYRALMASKGVASASLRSAARSRLKLLGLPEGSVRRLERGGAPQRTYAVVSRTGGVVTTIGARPGAQVSPGQSIVTIQGLGQVLVVADVPEASMGNIRVGQPAEIVFPAYAGEVRRGVVDYIFPSLNAQSRTAQVRITLPNPGGRLRSGMFANVTLQGAGGMAVVVPSEAVIDTGRRQLVIVRRGGSFVPQEIRTGRDYDQWTEIVAGLKPGEEVVASGQFLIDSEASLSGYLSRLQTTQAPPPRQAGSRGVVTSVDPAGFVTIRHEAIPELSWPAMTMTFKVRRPAMLRGLKRGLRVDFAVNPRPEGNQYIVERIGPEAGR
ncbi:MAG: efflux RND transporter periplasmic adaptor subunit [Pseudomonadota bacterium]|nr:efflux RND transporter periplasmic adaptor subunit [Pseudomonadota bacterium]